MKYPKWRQWVNLIIVLAGSIAVCWNMEWWGCFTYICVLESVLEIGVDYD